MLDTLVFATVLLPFLAAAVLLVLRQQNVRKVILVTMAGVLILSSLAMLRGGAFPATLERIPVKHLGLSAYPMNVFAPNALSAYESEDRSPVSANAPGYYNSPAPKQPAWHRGGEARPELLEK